VKIDDAVAIATKAVCKLKEHEVRRAKGRVDLDTTIMCYRGGEPAALLSLPVARDSMLQVAHIAAKGFGPDVMAITHDSLMVSGDPKTAVNDPRTGKPWEPNPGDRPGPMQTYVEEFGFDGTVVECLVTYVLNRAGDSAVVPQPYEVEGRSVKWLPFEHAGGEYSGDVPAALIKTMESSTLDQHVPPWAFGLVDHDPERARYHLDMATLAAIEKQVDLPVSVALFAEPGSPRAQMLRSKLARSQVIDPSRWN
jgi:hypothetical protein